jgi:sugar lactone lactonase YvrE
LQLWPCLATVCTTQRPRHTRALTQPTGPPTIAVYVADSDNNRIIRTDGEGTPASAITWGGAGTINTGPASFNTPRGLAVTDNGASLLVVDVNNRRIVKYSADGVYQLGFNGNTSGNPQFNVPFYVAADAANSIYVSDIAAANVQKFTAAGVFITKTPAGAGLAGPQGVAATPSGNPFVADSGSTPKVLRLTPDLQDAASFGTTSAGLGGIAVDSADRVYVPAQGQGVVEVFDSAGNLLIALTQVARPVNVALDRFGNLYVLGQGTGSVGRVHRFTPAPGLAFVTAWDVTANGLDSANPVGLAAY